MSKKEDNPQFNRTGTREGLVSGAKDALATSSKEEEKVSKESPPKRVVKKAGSKRETSTDKKGSESPSRRPKMSRPDQTRPNRNAAAFTDRHSFKVSEIMKGTNRELMKGMKDFMTKIAYQGFDPLKIAQTVKQLADNNNRNLNDDLFHLILIFYCRGANTDRLKNPNLSRIADEETQKTVTDLITTYDVRSKPGRSSTTVTLPRISLAFPAQTLKVLAGLVVVSGQKGGTAWVMESNVLPTIIHENHAWWEMYIMAQRSLSKKLSGNKPPPDTNERVESFAKITMMNSPFTPADKGKFCSLLDLALSYRSQHNGPEFKTWDNFLADKAG